MSTLSKPLMLGGIGLRNRIMISPMCTYSAKGDGLATDWHFVHYGKLAQGGAGLVMLEATAISEIGRHCYSDLGIWSDDHIAPLARIASFIKEQGSVPAIQLQHCGRKASARRPWHGSGALDETDLADRGEAPWQPIGPSPIAFGEDKPIPTEIRVEDMPGLIAEFVAAGQRARAAGFEVVEIHAAHGYFLNQFLSPLANHRGDSYGGLLENRMRFPLEVIRAVRESLAGDTALLVRLSCVDGVEGGWTLEESIVFAQELKAVGVDLVDCSSGGIGGAATMNRLARSPGFQVPFAEEIRKKAGIATSAVGLILTPEQAEEIVQNDRADIVAIGREALNDPNWPNMALTSLDGSYEHWPPNTGWWLERRAGILRSYEEEQRA